MASDDSDHSDSEEGVFDAYWDEEEMVTPPGEIPDGIDKGVWKELKRVDKFKRTALHRLAEKGTGDTVTMLVNTFGADPNAADCLGQTPLHYAQRFANTGFMQALVKHGARLGAKDMFGTTPTDAAVAKHVQDFMKKLASDTGSAAAAAADDEDSKEMDDDDEVAQPSTASSSSSAKDKSTEPETSVVGGTDEDDEEDDELVDDATGPPPASSSSSSSSSSKANKASKGNAASGSGAKAAGASNVAQAAANAKGQGGSLSAPSVVKGTTSSHAPAAATPAAGGGSKPAKQ